MDVIDLDFIGNPENPYRYWISNDLAKNATITIPEEKYAWDRLKTIEEQINSAILVLSVAVLALVAFALRKELVLLDVLTLGKDQAINLGVDYDRCIRRLLLGVTLYIATATAMVGPLAFLGLIIANLSRQFLRTYRHSQLITGSVLFGMAVLIGGQLLVERVFVYSVPVSVFITVGGGVYFLYLLLTQRKA